MPRQRKRKNERGKNNENLREAAREVLFRSSSLREAASSHSLCHVSLYRYVKKVRETNSGVDLQDSNAVAFPEIPRYNSHSKVFSDLQEKKLKDYIVRASDLYYGLSPIAVRRFAFVCANELDLKIPESWRRNEKAGVDWLSCFLKRQPDLSIRQPEATSLARAQCFNRATVNEFFNNLADVLRRHSFQPNNIYNMDETGVTTVQKPCHIVARKGVKQVGAVVSLERGTLVTCAVAVSATGYTVPPFLIFPRANYKEYFITGAPPGSVGAANKSGWMQEAEFCSYLRHFANHAKPTPEKPVLLLLDNHGSRIRLLQETGHRSTLIPPSHVAQTPATGPWCLRSI